MSVEEGSSGEECSLKIDTERRSEAVKKRGGRTRGRGGKGKAKQTGTWGDPKPGDVVWAKVMGFNFWPAKIFDAVHDDTVPVWLKQPPKPTYILVRFFGTYDMQWVSPSSVENYDKGLKKKFQSKSKSKIFQKAVKEVFAFMDDSVIPEGLTLRPPDPPSTTDSDEENEVMQNQLDSSAFVVTCDPEEFNPTHLRGSSRRKSATPRRFSNSSSDSHPSKRSCLDFSENGEGESNRLMSPEVEAFTCAPLPLVTPSSDEPVELKKVEGINRIAVIVPKKSET